MNTERIQAIRFFRENAGYVVGRRLLGAAELADAEHCAQSLGWEYAWEHDGYADLSWCNKEDLRKIEQGVWDVEAVVLTNHNGDIVASLCGIVGATPEYRRVVEAELALEADAAGCLEGIAA